MEPGSPVSGSHHYTMVNEAATTTVTTTQFKGIPVYSPGLLSLINKMNSQPLFQDTAYLFKNSFISIRIPLDKDDCGKKATPKIDQPWLKARVVDKLNHDNCYVLDVIGHEGKVISTTVANLEQGAAWIISLDVIHQQGMFKPPT